MWSQEVPREGEGFVFFFQGYLWVTALHRENLTGGRSSLPVEKRGKKMEKGCPVMFFFSSFLPSVSPGKKGLPVKTLRLLLFLPVFSMIGCIRICAVFACWGEVFWRCEVCRASSAFFSSAPRSFCPCLRSCCAVSSCSVCEPAGRR